MRALQSFSVILRRSPKASLEGRTLLQSHCVVRGPALRAAHLTMTTRGAN